jgi:hexosaminidase
MQPPFPKALLAALVLCAATSAPALETNPVAVATMLAAADTWLLPQPKAVGIESEGFDLKKCKGIRLVGCDDPWLKVDFPALLQERCGARLKAATGKPGRGCITLVLCPRELPPPGLKTLSPQDLAGLGAEGYCLRVERSGVTAGASTAEGLYYAARTLAQIANGRTRLPGMVIRDWPSLRYRGFQYDVSRGQMPTLATLKRLAAVTAEAKMNFYEPYLEHEFKWQRYPDIAPPEALTPAEARELFDYAARYRMDVHPLMQTFGHFYNIGTKPAYRKFMVEDGGTVDIRKPEAVAFVTNLIDEVCAAFPGKFLNVDITEIDDAAFKKTGTTQAELNELTFQYALQIRAAAARHGMRLMIAQAQLGAEGSLAGLGSVVERLPKDILISDYYTAEFYGGWEKDFPRLQKLGVQFLAQPWIDSHGHIMPYVGHAMDFSDIEISRGLQYGAVGSTTCDWGDDGHYHLPAVTWFPFVYHAASAWAGAKLDRGYFNQAFCRLFFGTGDDAIARAILLVGNINGQKLKLRNAAGGIDEPAYTGNSTFGRYYYEFFGDPFRDPKVLDIVEPGRKGRDILAPALEAQKLLQGAQGRATRNPDALERLHFTARNYEAMGLKLIARDHFLDPAVPRAQVAEELLALARMYEDLKAEFQRLWLADCKDAGSFRGYVQRFDNTITPCRKKAAELASAPPAAGKP